MEKGSSKKDSEKKIVVDIRRIPKRKGGLNGGSLILTIVLTLLLSYGIYAYQSYKNSGEQVPLSEIVSMIDEGKYDSITIKESEIILNAETGKDKVYALIPDGTDFYTVLADADIDIKSLENDFYEPNLNFTIGDLISILFLLAGGFMVFMLLRNMQDSNGKIMDFGQTKARLLLGKKTNIFFKDVAGIEEVKEELVEIVDFLKHPKKYIEAGARIPKGVLLVGAPGTGKTLLAKAVAGEAGVPFFHTSGSEFEEMLVGAGASRVRDLFKKARKVAPCIIFIDEIDAVAKKRGKALYSGAGEQTLNQILVEMDGLEERENVIVLAATNRPDVLDPAILRPGRFDRTVTVQMPDYSERESILKVHAKNKKFKENADLELVAKKTIGYSGADLENLLNEAAIMAAKRGEKEISQEDLSEAFLKVKLGRQKKRNREDEDIEKIAYHEAGHAVASKFVKGSSPVEQVSIISRGLTGGVTLYIPEKDTSLMTKTQLLAHIKTSVAGKVAEEVFFGEPSTGAQADIKSATDIAKAMVTQYGMSEKLGFVQYGDEEEINAIGYSYGGGRDFSEDTAKTIDQEIKRLTDEAQTEVRKILEDHKDLVKKLVDLLLKKEVVDRAEFEKLFE
jgi:cell division protease FtsH